MAIKFRTLLSLNSIPQDGTRERALAAIVEAAIRLMVSPSDLLPTGISDMVPEQIYTSLVLALLNNANIGAFWRNLSWVFCSRGPWNNR
jgi:hypothetical protein